MIRDHMLVVGQKVDATRAACEGMTLGDLRDTGTAYGPLINRAALEKVQAHQALALEKGTAC